MSEPDLSTLPQRMRYAATVVQEVNDRLVASCHANQYRAWHHDGLRALANTWSADDAEREAMVEELAREMYAEQVKCSTSGGSGQPGLFVRVATGLIESGWRKEIPHDR